MFSFLVEHKSSQKRLMFDLGMRNDTENLAPSVEKLITSGFVEVPPHKGIHELLEEGGIPLSSIDAVIWSHSHFDHIVFFSFLPTFYRTNGLQGDMSKFPNTTELIIGFETDTATYPQSPNANLQDMYGRQVTKVDFAAAKLTFSGLKVIDCFGDGSFYLLGTPGHMLGHLTALARVTPTTFIALGGDTFHESCLVGKEKVAAFAADPDIFVVIAHDASLRPHIPYFPESLNNWKVSRLKEKTAWSFLDKKNAAFMFSPINHTA
ncbi:beta-lactamase-like protein [Mycena vitilis]|nr:beta-lactamase-like protein [Mycena vitilis]